MGIYCLKCLNKINLDHLVFYNYAGSVKCFVCGEIMLAKISRGVVTHLHSEGRTEMLPVPAVEQIPLLLPAPPMKA